MHRSQAVKPREVNSKRPVSSHTWSGLVTPGALPGGWGGSRSSQSTAKDWVQRCNAKRELEALKQQQWLETTKHFKAAQLKADLYHHRPSAPRCCPTPNAQNRWDSEKSSHVLPVPGSHDIPEPAAQVPLSSTHDNAEVFQSDEAETTSNTGFKSTEKRYNLHILSDESTYLKPEIAALRGRLEELKKRNAEERQKLNEELSFRAWQSSSTEARQMESERLQQFVRSAWIDQRKWKEDERLRRELEDKKIEEEAAAIRRRQEEEEHRIACEKQAKREEYQKELEEQLVAMKKQKEEKARLESIADDLVCERDKLLAVVERREQLLQARKSRSLAVSWARQHHIKLRQRALQVIQEVNEDLALMRDFMELQRSDHTSGAPKQNDLAFVMSVLEEHKKLEQLREKEYDLLFSEEAARLWRMREQQWEREAEARNKLLNKVFQARERQINERTQMRTMAEDKLKHDCEEAKQRISSVEEKLARLEIERPETFIGGDGRGLKEAVRFDAVSRNRTDLFDEQEEVKHRKEIARLEAEMARLWGPLYAPPQYGRKKVHW
ncbi:hypothetical protein FHG87_007473 [Trinorchestia longiramus]|nr:hypothetical protein FHG87_007473 [Trinorchestia longiramus]